MKEKKEQKKISNSIWKNYFLWHLNGTEIQQVDDLTNRFIIQSFFSSSLFIAPFVLFLFPVFFLENLRFEV